MSTDEQRVYSNAVHTMVVSFEKFLEEYETIETASSDLCLLKNLLSINNTLNRLLGKRKLDILGNSDDDVTMKHGELGTLITDGDGIKKKKTETRAFDDEKKRVMKEAEKSIIRSLGSSSDDESTENENAGLDNTEVIMVSSTVKSQMKDVLEPTVAVQVSNDPHMSQVATDVFKCDICRINNLSSANALTHVVGKQHRNKVKQKSRESSESRIHTVKPSPIIYNTEWDKIEKVISASTFRCRICDVEIYSEQNVKQHVEGVKHKKELQQLSKVW